MPRVEHRKNLKEPQALRRPLTDVEREQLHADASRLAWELIAEESEEERPRPAEQKTRRTKPSRAAARTQKTGVPSDTQLTSLGSRGP